MVADFRDKGSSKTARSNVTKDVVVDTELLHETPTGEKCVIVCGRGGADQNILLW
jgi:hypothetical protein